MIDVARKLADVLDLAQAERTPERCALLALAHLVADVHSPQGGEPHIDELEMAHAAGPDSRRDDAARGASGSARATSSALSTE